MLCFSDISQLEKILEIATKEYYKDKWISILNNYKTAHNYYLIEDYIYTSFLRNLQTGRYQG